MPTRGVESIRLSWFSLQRYGPEGVEDSGSSCKNTAPKVPKSLDKMPGTAPKGSNSLVKLAKPRPRRGRTVWISCEGTAPKASKPINPTRSVGLIGQQSTRFWRKNCCAAKRFLCQNRHWEAHALIQLCQHRCSSARADQHDKVAQFAKNYHGIGK